MANRIYPESPRVGVGALVIHEGKVLLIKRGVAPNEGLWAVPGGSLELGESLKQCAERETLEETGLVVRAETPIYVFDYVERDPAGEIRFHFVIIDLKATYISGNPVGQDDALEARWVGKEDIDALPVGENTLKVLRYMKYLD
jgi:ADP-ribose pyrophosphatase